MTLFTAEEKTDQEAEVLKVKIDELKAKGVDELAKKGAHADQFIDFLKEQNAALTAELAKKEGTDNAALVLEELKKQREIAEAPKVPDGTGSVPEDLNSLIEQNLLKINQRKALEANLLSVDVKVKSIYGEKSKEVMAQKAQELGLTIEYLGDVAARSPQAFYALVGMDKSAGPTGNASTGTVNSDALGNHNSVTPGTKSYYDNIKKTQGKAAYYSPKVQQQMFKDRQRLGDEAFYK